MAKAPKHVRTSHPSRMLGRLPNDPSKPRLHLRALAGAPSAPTSADWLSQISTWSMSLNDQLGCCVASGAVHAAVACQWYGQNKSVSISDTDTLKMYSAISGYNGNPRTDVGATLQDGLNYWRKSGIGGYTVEAFAQLDARNLDLIRNCIAIFGGVYTGMNFPGSAMDQFNAGQPWTVARRSQLEGGHCVPIGAYDANSFTCVTWGRSQKMDVAFFQQYFDEIWVPIDTAWLRAAGTSPAGLDVATLNADYQALTGQPGPFQGVAPPADPPVVDPPVVVPPVDPPSADPDVTVAAAMRSWLTAKGL